LAGFSRDPPKAPGERFASLCLRPDTVIPPPVCRFCGRRTRMGALLLTFFPTPFLTAFRPRQRPPNDSRFDGLLFRNGISARVSDADAVQLFDGGLLLPALAEAAKVPFSKLTLSHFLRVCVPANRGGRGKDFCLTPPSPPRNSIFAIHGSC